jgi:SHS2 domain-containing protein
MYELLPHTADVRLRVVASSQEELFADALRGVMSVTEPREAGEGVHADFELTAPDTTMLLVDFLNEALTRSHVRRETFRRVVFRELTAVSLAAELEGNAVGELGEDVKAVTLHDAEVRHEGGRWSVVLVLDL